MKRWKTELKDGDDINKELLFIKPLVYVTILLNPLTTYAVVALVLQMWEVHETQRGYISNSTQGISSKLESFHDRKKNHCSCVRPLLCPRSFVHIDL